MSRRPLTDILISIKPKWCKLIEEGTKVIEVRRSKPQVELPVDCYIYCSSSVTASSREYAKKKSKRVVGKFTCSQIEVYKPFLYDGCLVPTREAYGSCLAEKDIKSYSDNGRHWLYLWHIENLEIFDEPKELSEFSLARPPQSFCYLR